MSLRKNIAFKSRLAGFVLLGFFAFSAQSASGDQIKTQAKPANLKSQPAVSASNLNLTAVPVLPGQNGDFLQDFHSLFISLGISSDEWGSLTQNKSLLAKAGRLPQEVRKLYKSMSFFDKIKLRDKVEGTTDTPFFTIENKPAFVTGKAHGYDAFAYLRASAQAEFAAGKINQEECRKKIQAVDVVSKLTPEQRGTLVDLLEQDLKAHG